MGNLKKRIYMERHSISSKGGEDSPYHIPIQYKKEFTSAQSTDIVQTFANYDLKGEGKIGKGEFKATLIDMGYREIKNAQVDELLTLADKDGSGTVEWSEFCDMMYKLIKQTNEENASPNTKVID